MAENTVNNITSLGKSLMMRGGDPNVLAYYGPYTSLENAVLFFATSVKNYLGDVPAGYKVGIGTLETVDGLPTWTHITQEYEYIGGAITALNFVPLIITDNNQLSNGAGYITSSAIKAGSNVSLLTNNNQITISATDTTYNNATTSAAGLMSASDKQTLEQLIPVVEAGGWNVDSNGQVGGTLTSSSGGATSAEVQALQAQVNRIINILGGLYDDNGDANIQVTSE